MRKGQHKEQPKERRCRVCKNTKPIEEFGINRYYYFGYNYVCKQCRRERIAI
jgi:superfamily II helicase